MRILLILLVLSLITAPLSLAQDSDDDPRLIQAVYASDDRLVESLLDTGANPNVQEEGEDGWTGLILAAYYGNRKIVELLLAAGADPNLPDHEGKTALLHAAQSGRTEALQLLLTAGAAPNHQDEQGKSALHWAAEHGQTHAVEWLLSVGVDPNLQDNQERTAAQLAREYGHEAISLSIEGASPTSIAIGNLDLIAAVRGKDLVMIDHLLKSGVDISMQDENGWTALHWAGYEGEINIVSLLLAAGADTSIRNDEGLTALQRVRKRGHHNIAKVIERAAPSTTELIQAVRNNDAAEVNRLLATRGDPNQLAGSPKTALDWAAMDANTHIVRQLLAAGADANLPGQYSWVPLLSAATWAPIQLVDLLLSAGAEIDHQSDAGWTALILAADQERADVVELLLHAGADVNLQNEYGWTALMMAAYREHAEMVDALLDAGADVSPRRTDHVSGYNAAEWARERGFFEIANAIEQAPPVELRAPKLGEKLISAASASQYEEVEQLLAAGADPNAQDENGKTALHWAAEHQRDDLVMLLLDAGADVNLQDDRGYTALIYAITEEEQRGVPAPDLNLIQRLIDAGTDLNLKTAAGGNAFSYSTNAEVMSLLQEAEPHPIELDDIGLSGLMLGAIQGDERLVRSHLGIDDPNAVDATGINTALRYALRLGHSQIATQLLNHGADPSHANINGETALYWAIQAGDATFVNLLTRLRQRNVELDRIVRTDSYSDAPLLLASHLRNATLVEMLLRAGADPDIADHHQGTALMEAAYNGDLAVIELLLAAGADVSLRNTAGQTAAAIAESRGHTDLAQLIEDAASPN